MKKESILELQNILKPQLERLEKEKNLRNNRIYERWIQQKDKSSGHH